MFAYILYKVTPEAGKTVNATFFEQVTSAWSRDSRSLFLYVILVSEAALLFAASQTGFVDGPRVLANMALDHWFPTRFTILSDRLVTQNGVLLMGRSIIGDNAFNAWFRLVSCYTLQHQCFYYLSPFPIRNGAPLVECSVESSTLVKKTSRQ
jgi:hypothetical protein